MNISGTSSFNGHKVHSLSGRKEQRQAKTSDCWVEGPHIVAHESFHVLSFGEGSVQKKPKRLKFGA